MCRDGIISLEGCQASINRFLRFNDWIVWQFCRTFYKVNWLNKRTLLLFNCHIITWLYILYKSKRSLKKWLLSFYHFFLGHNLTLSIIFLFDQGVPVIMSTPHFLDGDPQLVENIDGIDPVRELHQTYLHLEPLSG